MVSADEHAILDQLNGLVLAGEIALERLQAAGQRRVRNDGEFTNHYDLANHLLGHAELMQEAPISESGLGRIDLLFQLLQHIQLAKPERIAPYLESLHGDFESRPLAEQIVDALLNEDADRYEIYRQIRRERNESFADVADDRYAEIGHFISRWQQLERILIDATPEIESHLSVAHRLKAAVAQGIIEESLVPEIDSLRRLRNRVVHGLDAPSPATLRRATNGLVSVLGKIRRAD